jgi:hypothetical protein
MNDCLNIVAEYLQSNEVSRLGRTFAVRHFPKKINLTSYYNVYLFIKWCRLFDTTNLKEVIFGLDCIDKHCIDKDGNYFQIPEKLIIGWVPPSVKKVWFTMFSAWVPMLLKGYSYQISDTVDECYLLHIPHYFTLSDSIKKLSIAIWCVSSIEWPSQLEDVHIFGYGYNLDTIAIQFPNSVRNIRLGSGLNIDIVSWPLNLQTVTIDAGFIPLHPEVPKHVIYTII